MYDKTKLFNLTLNALLVKFQIVDADTDQSVEAKILRNNWEPALFGTLEELDLDKTTSIQTLELIQAAPTDSWAFAYKYPTDAAFIRRIVSGFVKDNQETKIPLRTGIFNNKAAIFTNEASAEVEYVSKEVPLNALSAWTGRAVALNLASMSSGLITGKNALQIKQGILNDYAFAKFNAKEQDQKENLTFDDPTLESSWVSDRTS